MNRDYWKRFIKSPALVDVKSVAKIIRKVQKQDKDMVVGVSGGEGIGKSTLIILLMIMLDRKFKFSRNLIFMPTEELIKKSIYKLPKKTPLSFDEAMKSFYKRDWQKKERKALNVLFSVVRKRNLAFFFAIPNIWDLDSYYLQHRIKMWIYVVERGKALIFLRDDNPFEDDCWHRKENKKVVNRALKGKVMVSPQVMANALKKSKNFAYEMTFPDLPEKMKETYVRKAEEEFEKIEGEEDVENDKTKLYRLKIEKATEFLYRKGWTQLSLSKLFDYSVSTIVQILKKRKATKKHLMLEQKELDKEVVDMLKDSDSKKNKIEFDKESNVLEKIKDSESDGQKGSETERNVINEVFG